MQYSLEVLPALRPGGIHVLDRVKNDRGVAFIAITAAIESGRPLGIVRARAEAWLREVFLPKALARCDDQESAGRADLNTTVGIAMALSEITRTVVDLTREAGKPALRVA